MRNALQIYIADDEAIFKAKSVANNTRVFPRTDNSATEDIGNKNIHKCIAGAAPFAQFEGRRTNSLK